MSTSSWNWGLATILASIDARNAEQALELASSVSLGVARHQLERVQLVSPVLHAENDSVLAEWYHTG